LGNILELLRYKQKQAKIEPLMAQMNGLLTSIVALDSTIRGEYHAIDQMKSRLNNFIGSEEFHAKVLEKRGRYGSMSG
jgi:hypothetical protein